MSIEAGKLSPEIVTSIVDSMFPTESREDMVRRRLREDGHFEYLKLAGQSLPNIPESSGLRVVNCGIAGYDAGNAVDSFMVYDPKRVEVRTIDDVTGPESHSAKRELTEKGFKFPFPQSRLLLVGIRPIDQTQKA